MTRFGGISGGDIPPRAVCYVGKRLITRMMAVPVPMFSVSSSSPLLQLHTSPVLATNSPPWICLTRSSPYGQWQTMSLAIGTPDANLAFG